MALHTYLRSSPTIALIVFCVSGVLGRTPAPDVDNEHSVTNRLITVSDPDQFKSAVQNAQAGDVIEVLDGKYETDGMTMYGSGTLQNPIIIRAQNTGQSEIIGESYFDLRQCAYVVIQGFLFTSSAYTVVKLEACQNIRITRNTFRIAEEGSGKWVLIGGIWNDPNALSHHNRIDHNLFEEKHQLGNFITIDGSPDPVYQSSQYDRIDHNHFRNIGPRAENEMEAVRIGWSELSMSNGYTIVEYNLFENCDGDPEIISVKTCSDTIRYNTFIECQGTLSLRHGNGSVVNGNYFFGRGKVGTGGIRLYGDDHIIYNNYFEGLTGTIWDAPITLTNGDYDGGSSLSKHFRINRAKILHNTLVANDHNIEIGFTNSGKYTKPPRDVQINNNIVSGTQNELIRLITAPVNMTWSHNIFFPEDSAVLGISSITDEEIKQIDPELVYRDSVYHIDSSSPAIDYGDPVYSYIINDMDGQNRSGIPDAGADEYDTGEVIITPMKPDKVGPYAKEIVNNIYQKESRLSISNNKLEVSPNPFNASTKFKFILEKFQRVRIKIFDINGRFVTTVTDKRYANGNHSIDWHAGHIASGIYIYQFEHGRKSQNGRLLLVK